MQNNIKILVPASTANLGPGFDTLGLALNLYNEFEFSFLNDSTFQMSTNADLPTDKTNIVYKSFAVLFTKSNKSIPGVSLEVKASIPLNAGLGSSSTAIVAGLVAANYFLGDIYTKNDILNIACEIEGHPDNVASAIFGGLTISSFSEDIVFVKSVPVKTNFSIIALTPNFPLPTKDARSVLPKSVSYSDAVSNISQTALMVAAFYENDIELLKHCFSDRLHEPYRKKLIPGFDDVCSAARHAGAVGVFLSGAGPTIVALVNSRKNSEKVLESMKSEWNKLNVLSVGRILDVDDKGYVLK